STLLRGQYDISVPPSFPTRRSSDLPAFCLSTTVAMRFMTSMTWFLSTMPWCSQLAMCCDEIRQVARSSISPTSLMSGTLEQPTRSEEHTSELQSRENLVCRLLLEKR